MPDAAKALDSLWSALEQTKLMASTAQERLIAERAPHEAAITLIDERIAAWAAAEQMAWDAENQFHDIKVALGLEEE